MVAVVRWSGPVRLAGSARTGRWRWWRMVNTPYYAEPFLGLGQAVDQLLNESVVGAPLRGPWARGGAGTGQTAWPLPLDVYAAEQEVVVVAAIPGMRPEDLQVPYNQGT